MAETLVLITRPEAEAEQLAAKLQRLKIKTVSIPAFRFEPGFEGTDFAKHWHKDVRRLAIFSSPRAVEFALRQLPSTFFEGAEIAAIGPATAALLESAGYQVPIIPESQFNSESLLEHPALCSKPGSALVFAAPGGRQRLFLGLAALGWKTNFAHVYRAMPLQPGKDQTKALLNSQFILSIWTSANAMEHLAGHLDGTAWERVCRGDFLVTSDRLAKLASHYCKNRIKLASGPGNDALALAVLAELRK